MPPKRKRDKKAQVERQKLKKKLRKEKKTKKVDPEKEKEEQDPKKRPPKSFVFRRGKVANEVVNLVFDLRKVMSPHTAAKLKETKQNQLKDFVVVAPDLGVTHFLIFSQSLQGVNLRVIRLPRGPTITFRVTGYTLCRDIARTQKKPHSPGIELRFPPLVVLSNFSQKEDYKQLIASMFQNMFPPIDVRKLKLSECRRVVLVHLDKESGFIEFRHYLINASPVGLTRPVKKIIQAQIPNLGHLEDISDYVHDYAGQSDSEAEDTPDSKIKLPQNFHGRGNLKKQTSAIRLKELGPRMTMELLKIEEEFCSGRVLYHSYIKKTREEAEELVRAAKAKEASKMRRKRQQEANVQKKKEQKEKEKKGKRAKDAEDNEQGEDEQEGEDAADDDFLSLQDEVIDDEETKEEKEQAEEAEEFGEE